MNFKKMLENYADEINLKLMDHPDHEKCGQCHKVWLRHEIAKGYLANKKTDDIYLKSFFEEEKRQWEKSKLFKLVKSYQKKGLPLEEALKKVEEKGFLP